MYKKIEPTKIIELKVYRRARKMRKINGLIETIHSPELKYPFYIFVSLSLLITVSSVFFFFFYII